MWLEQCFSNLKFLTHQIHRPHFFTIFCNNFYNIFLFIHAANKKDYLPILPIIQLSVVHRFLNRVQRWLYRITVPFSNYSFRFKKNPVSLSFKRIFVSYISCCKKENVTKKLNRGRPSNNCIFSCVCIFSLSNVQYFVKSDADILFKWIFYQLNQFLAY